LFLTSDAGQGWHAALVAAIDSALSYPAEQKPDGSFVFEDVAAGSYKLEADVFDDRQMSAPEMHRVPGGVPLPQKVASGTVSFDVPAMPTGRSDEPLMLPTIALHTTTHPSTSRLR
jgi:hypothetical protein